MQSFFPHGGTEDPLQHLPRAHGVTWDKDTTTAGALLLLHHPPRWADPHSTIPNHYPRQLQSCWHTESAPTQPFNAENTILKPRDLFRTLKLWEWLKVLQQQSAALPMLKTSGCSPHGFVLVLWFGAWLFSLLRVPYWCKSICFMGLLSQFMLLQRRTEKS